jgi:hypothetical protein
MVRSKITKGDGTVERYFHVDSDETLSEGAMLSPKQIPNSLDEPVRDCFCDLFPAGVSTWGFAYLFESHEEGLVYDELSAAEHGLAGEDRNRAIRRARNRTIELITELIRVNWAPERPSRLASVFAYSTLAVAREFRSTRCTNPSAPIWEIEAEGAFGCDSSWLGLGESIPMVVIKTKRYWSGRLRTGSLPVDREQLLHGAAVAVNRCD